MIEAKILLDSRGPCSRLTTFIVTYPRFILAEVNTHRMLSRNSPSSRAIPVKKIIEKLQSDPAMPVFWGRNQSGMQAATELDEKSIELCKKAWLEARDLMIAKATELIALGLHKQIANRILEPWMYTTSLVTATEWENFFALRAHPDAQPEFQDLAYKMLDEYNKSEPQILKHGEWHIPFSSHCDGLDLETKLKVCVARAARVSYANFDGEIDINKDLELYEKLKGPGHMSPFEHSAEASDEQEWYGNFFGFVQYRKTLSNENRQDERVKK